MAEKIDVEDQLIIYIKNILKYQIMPMDYMNLRNLIKDAPKNMKLYEYVEEKYPGPGFLAFLQKYPEVFNLNLDRTVMIAGPNYCTLNDSPKCSDEKCDEVDGRDQGEYISGDDTESNNSDAEEVKLLNHDKVVISVVNDPSHLRERVESSSSSCSDSSDDFFSSEMVQTSDSSHSSLSSDSSSEN